MLNLRIVKSLLCLLPLIACLSTRAHSQDGNASSDSKEQVRIELDRLRDKHHLPALWGGRFQADGKSAVSATGLRKWGKTTQVETTDKVHIGSCTKAMTGLLIAQLISDDKLKFETTLAEIFPDTPGLADSGWGKVTVNELLQHRSGAPANADWQKLHDAHPSDLQAGRQATLEWLIKSKRPKKPTFLYSNVGFVMLGHIVEKLRGESWEVVIQQRLFEPLNISSAGFGPVGGSETLNKAAPQYPFGHTPEINLSSIVSQLMSSNAKLSFTPTRVDNPAVMNPAGRVHVRIEEWSRFVLLFASENAPQQLGINDATWQRLKTPEFAGNYAGGWVVEKPTWSTSKTLWHNGSNTTWYCVAYAVPDQQCCLIAVSNAYCSQADQACAELIESLSKIKL